MKKSKGVNLLYKVGCKFVFSYGKKYMFGVWLSLTLLLASCENEDSKMIVCWGDSLTAPHVGATWKGKIKYLLLGDDSYPNVLQSKVGKDYNIINAGIGGENTLTIMARQGAYPMKLAHEVTLYRDESRKFKQFMGNRSIPTFRSSYNGKVVTPLLQLGWEKGGPSQVNPCYIEGKEYILESESQFWKESGNYVFEYNYFIDSEENLVESKKLSEGAIVETYAMRHLRDAYANVFFMGQNGGFENVADLISQYRAMIDYSRCDKYIIISFHKPNGGIPSISRMKEMEDSLQMEFGEHYINLRDYMVNNGLKDAALTPTDIDNDSISRGQVPPQLIPDGCHFTSKGYALLANLVWNRMKKLGYIKD